ncbi:hypothetical protein [Massilia sp. CF038]|uniref:hypothetical protein n=1 Tax=Massilia sp. CF038 TaxID=1881045 RepID=UPI000917E1C8|nr:hypothetical protein [Massilia sp. CF038]SHH24903.1 hypothetical protein SAMN05428948_3507 [Massilia sp. CF038]
MAARYFWRGAAAALALAAPLAHAGWQDTPDSLHLQPVGEHMKVNGTPMEIRAFSSTVPVAQLLDTVEAEWKRSGMVTRTVASTWTVLNQTVGEQHRSLQVRTGGAATDGFVALTSPKQARPPKLAIALPSDVTAVSIVDSSDQGKTSQQVIAVSRRSPSATVNALESTLRGQGWQRQHLHINAKGAVFSANRGDEQFDATLSAQRAGSLLMMNTIIN